MASVGQIPVIGLVGGIGSGKSAVAAVLAAEGCVVCDSDELVRRQYREPAVRAQLQTWWGPGILDESGSVDRAAVAAIVFRDPAERARLEAFLHPRVEEERARQFAAAPAGTPALVIDAPLLLEAGLAPSCSVIWFVDAPESLRRARVMGSRGWTAEELVRREAAQWSLDRKRAAAHHVLRNDGDPASLREQVRPARAGIRRPCRPSRGRRQRPASGSSHMSSLQGSARGFGNRTFPKAIGMAPSPSQQRFLS